MIGTSSNSKLSAQSFRPTPLIGFGVGLGHGQHNRPALDHTNTTHIVVRGAGGAFPWGLIRDAIVSARAVPLEYLAASLRHGFAVVAPGNRNREEVWSGRRLRIRHGGSGWLRLLRAGGARTFGFIG